MGTTDGGVHVLSIEVNPEAEEEQVPGMTSKHPRMGEGTPSGSPRPGEDASGDMYSSSSVTRSRPPTPPLHELAIEQAGEWLVRAYILRRCRCVQETWAFARLTSIFVCRKAVRSCFTRSGH